MLCHYHIRTLTGFDAAKALSDDEARAVTDALTAARAGVEQPLIDALSEEYDRQANEVDANLDAVLGEAEAHGWSPQWIWVLLSAAAFEAFVDEEAVPLLEIIAEEGFVAGSILTGGGAPSEYVLSPGARSTLSESVSLIKNTDAETRRVLDKIISTGVEQQLGKEAIGEAIRRQFDDWAAKRAETVAQTASTGVFSHGSLDAYSETGVPKKGWLAVMDRDTRETHAAAHGQEVAINESFVVGGASLRFPGDPFGPPGETINCRCVVFPVASRLAWRDKAAEHAAVELTSWHKMKPAERSRIDMAVRDLSVRTCYPVLREQMGQLGARAYLAEVFGMSEDNVKKVCIRPK